MDKRCDNIKNIEAYCDYAFHDIVWSDWIFIANPVIACRVIMASP